MKVKNFVGHRRGSAQDSAQDSAGTHQYRDSSLTGGSDQESSAFPTKRGTQLDNPYELATFQDGKIGGKGSNKSSSIGTQAKPRVKNLNMIKVQAQLAGSSIKLVNKKRSELVIAGSSDINSGEIGIFDTTQRTDLPKKKEHDLLSSANLRLSIQSSAAIKQQPVGQSSQKLYTNSTHRLRQQKVPESQMLTVQKSEAQQRNASTTLVQFNTPEMGNYAQKRSENHPSFVKTSAQKHLMVSDEVAKVYKEARPLTSGAMKGHNRYGKRRDVS